MAADAKKSADKAAAKEARKAKRAQRTQNFKQMWEAFNVLRKQDKKLIPLMLIVLLGTMLVMFLVGLIWNGQWWMLILGIPLGLMLAFLLFTKRLERSMYERVENETGAAGWALENMRNTVGVAWVTKTGIAGTTQMDVIHRVVGNPGVVLVGEGNRNRLKPLMKQQTKRIDRVLGGVPIYELYVGKDEEADEVPLQKLQRRMLKFPRNYRKNEVHGLAARLDALDHVRGGQQQGLPKGPMPKQAQNMSGMNRRMRRASERRGK